MKKRWIGAWCGIMLLLAGCSSASTSVSPEQEMVAQWSESLTSAGYIEEDLQTSSEQVENNAVWGDYTYRGYTVQPGLYFYTCSDDSGNVLEACAYCDTSLFSSSDYSEYATYGYMSGILLASIDSENMESVVDALSLDDPALFLQSHNDSYTADDVDYQLIYDTADGKMFFQATMQ